MVITNKLEITVRDISSEHLIICMKGPCIMLGYMSWTGRNKYRKSSACPLPAAKKKIASRYQKNITKKYIHTLWQNTRENWHYFGLDLHLPHYKKNNNKEREVEAQKSHQHKMELQTASSLSSSSNQYPPLILISTVTSRLISAHWRHSKRRHWRHSHTTHGRWNKTSCHPSSSHAGHRRCRQSKGQQLSIHILQPM